MLPANQMQSLPSFFAKIPDPRRAQGRRHRLATILAIAAGATCVACADTKRSPIGPKGLGQRARQRFGCRYEKDRYLVPSQSIIRDVLIRVDRLHLDRALQRWNQTYAQEDESLAIDGKTMCNAIDEQGIKPIFSASSVIRVKTAMPKKSRHPAGRRPGKKSNAPTRSRWPSRCWKPSIWRARM